MITTVRHMTSSLGLRKFQAAWFLLNRGYMWTNFMAHGCCWEGCGCWATQIPFYGTHRFITVLARTPTINLILDQLIPLFTLPGSILILTSHLHLVLWLPPSLGCWLIKVFFAFVISVMHAASPPISLVIW
jgi:hypothetical protein